jgi:type IV pilus assembly protein PilM
MARKILALDIGSSNVVLAEYAYDKGSFTLLNYGKAALAAPLDADNVDFVLSPALQSIAREKGIKPGKVVVSLSGQMVFQRFASIPATSDSDRFEQLVRYEIEQNVPFPIDETVCDSDVIGETEVGDSSVLLVAAKTEQVEALSAAVVKAGFEPEIVDVTPIALTNALRAITDSEEEGSPCSLVLDIGAKTTSLVISDGDKLYTRSIPVAGNTLTKEIAQALGCSMEEAEEYKTSNAYVSMGGVAEDQDETADNVSNVCRTVMTKLYSEISRSINFYRGQQGGNAPQKMYLTGGTSLLPQAAEFFASELQMEVEFLDIFSAVSCSPNLDDETLSSESVYLASTFGAALHAVDLAGISVNLMPPSLVSAKEEKFRIGIVGVSGLLAIIAMGGIYFAACKNRNLTSEKLDRINSNVQMLQGKANRIKKETTTFESAQTEALRLQGFMMRRSAAVTKINALRQAIGDELWIESWDGDRVTIRGWRDRIKAFTSYVAAQTKSNKVQPASEIVRDRLRANPAVIPDSVKVVEAKYLGKSDCIEQFVVELKFK